MAFALRSNTSVGNNNGACGWDLTNLRWLSGPHEAGKGETPVRVVVEKFECWDCYTSLHQVKNKENVHIMGCGGFTYPHHRQMRQVIFDSIQKLRPEIQLHIDWCDQHVFRFNLLHPKCCLILQVMLGTGFHSFTVTLKCCFETFLR